MCVEDSMESCVCVSEVSRKASDIEFGLDIY